MAPQAIRKKKNSGNPAWKKGRSANPSGRPKLGESLAEFIRAKLNEYPKGKNRTNLELIIDKTMHLARLGSEKHIHILVERGWGKVMEPESRPRNPSDPQSGQINIYLPDNGRPDIVINNNPQ